MKQFFKTIFFYVTINIKDKRIEAEFEAIV